MSCLSSESVRTDHVKSTEVFVLLCKQYGLKRFDKNLEKKVVKNRFIKKYIFRYNVSIMIHLSNNLVFDQWRKLTECGRKLKIVSNKNKNKNMNIKIKIKIKT